MKAIVCPTYGPPDVLQMVDQEMPEPGPNEIRVRVHATEVTSGDDRMRGAKFPGLFWLPVRMALGFTGPRQSVLGASFSGVVHKVGESVSRFEVGDAVCGATGPKLGSHSEYVCVSEREPMVKKPDSVSHEQAAALFFGGNTALHFLRLGPVKAGDHLLVYGASGCLGTYGVQLGKQMGAHVTAVCSGPNADFVRNLGADEVKDYTERDFALPTATYDAIFETVGKADFAACAKALKPGGAFLRAVHLEAGSIMRGIWHSMFGKIRVVGGMARESQGDLEALMAQVEAGAIRPVIDQTLPATEFIEAHRRVDSGRKRGSVVLTFG